MVAQHAAEGTRAHGIRAMSMTLVDAQTGRSLLDPNTEKFTLLSAAINTGIKIVELDAGR
ncbi:hypothetical protein INS49_014003 [Diaporthe citri]|uniref:uncharacterized protein n=1 Tax=Diaporthe citri TaxID=83186 RepID=UPI001C81C83D|nr:uncharacterized protein INS49_014003 [Diaporthe citri]KAG6358119.1 hypothetical protein INS49_014003 [Diaporthe citri]